MPISPENILDIAQRSRKSVTKREFVNLTTDRQKFFAMPWLLGREHTATEAGPGVEWKIMKDTEGTARATEYYEADDLKAKDVLANCLLTFRQVEASYVIDVRELTDAVSPEKILDAIMTKEHGMWMDLAEYLEAKFWSLVPASNTKDIFGLPYYVVKNATSGFTGSNPSGYSAVANVDSDVITRYRNWGGTYAALTEEDGLAAMIEMWRKTMFESPRRVPELAPGQSGSSWYCNYVTWAALQREMRSRNDNHQTSLTWKDGQASVMDRIVEWVPYLDASTDNPIYKVDWSALDLVLKKGEVFRRTGPDKLSGMSHNEVASWVDLATVPRCWSRRALGVLYQA